MSLDVYLESDTAHTEPERWAIFVRENGQNVEITREEWDRLHPGVEPAMAKVGGESRTVYHRNITHNLNTMAEAAGIYQHLWRPEEIEITRAKQLVVPLTLGLKRLRSDPDRFKFHNPPNGWGNYDGFVAFVSDYLEACKAHPHATVRVCR